MSAPAWMVKFPCKACGAGYGICRQGAPTGWMCCKDCSHPATSWTAEDLMEMWAGQENVPPAHMAVIHAEYPGWRP